MSTTCKSCGAEIVWGITSRGRRMPLDIATVAGGTWQILDGMIIPRHLHREQGQTSHFATCPNADQHRKPR